MLDESPPLVLTATMLSVHFITDSRQKTSVNVALAYIASFDSMLPPGGASLAGGFFQEKEPAKGSPSFLHVVQGDVTSLAVNGRAGITDQGMNSNATAT